MTIFTRTHTVQLIDDAMNPYKRGRTTHLPGRSGHGRFIVGGVMPSIKLPHFQVRHPATVGFITERLTQAIKDYPNAETVGSWRDGFMGDVYFDLSTTHDDRGTALHLARLRGERAIYDTHADESIYL